MSVLLREGLHGEATAELRGSPITTGRRRSRKVAGLVEHMETPHRFTSYPGLQDLVSWKDGPKLPIHRWFRYREGFSPRLIAELGLRAPILDPFCGSGSIMIGAAQNNQRAIGIDINPLAVFIARRKLTPLSPRELSRAADFLSTVGKKTPLASLWPSPSLRIASKLFEPTIVDTLMRIRTLIEDESGAVRDFLFLAWISILQEVGNYFKEGNGIKYRNRKRLPSGYVQIADGEWQLARFGVDHRSFTLTAFGRQLQAMLSDADAWKHGSWSNQRVVEGDALNLGMLVQGETFPSTIFSPPYANRFDYFESLKVELWFGGFVKDYSDLALLRKRSLRSHLGADLRKPSVALPELEALLELMDRSSSSWRMKVPSALRGYFHDMSVTLQRCHEVAPRGGRCFVVVGNSAYAGVIVPTDVLLANLGLAAGFKQATIHVVRHLTVAPQQRVALGGLEAHMRESLLEFTA